MENNGMSRVASEIVNLISILSPHSSFECIIPERFIFRLGDNAVTCADIMTNIMNE